MEPTSPAFGDVRVVAAVISAAVAFAVWALKSVLEFAGGVRRRRNDVLGTLQSFRAEFLVSLDISDVAAQQTRWDDIIARLRADPSFVPFITVEDTDAFSAKNRLEDLRRLPAEAQAPIIRAYRIDAMVNAVLHDLQTDRFRLLEPDRKIMVLTALKEKLHQSSQAQHGAVMVLDQAVARQRRYWRPLA